MSMLQDHLTSEVANWEFVGHHALLQRFVLRNGKAYTPTKLIGKRGQPKQCFTNASKAVFRNAGLAYVEGFAINRVRPLLAFHHAWATADDETAMDFTLKDAADYDFFGIAFDRQTFMIETARNKFYGLLDTGLGMNVRLMFRIDPELKAIVEAVKPSDAWQKAQAAHG